MKIFEHLANSDFIENLKVIFKEMKNSLKF